MNRGDACVVPLSFSLPFMGRVVAKRPGGECEAGRRRCGAGVPHPCSAAPRRPSPLRGREKRPGTTLRRLLSRRFGEGAGRPGLARCCCRVTVSTKPDLGRPSDPPVKSRSGRDGTAPRSRFPRAIRLAALASGLTGSSVADIAACGGGGTWRSQQSAPLARGEQAEAIHRPPQGPPRYPSPGLHRSTTARRTSGRWIRRPPHRRDGGIMEAV